MDFAELNPYESPLAVGDHSLNWRRRLMRAASLACGLLSLLLTLAAIDVSLYTGTPEVVRDKLTIEWWGLVFIMYPLPAIGMMILGFACWRQSWQLAFVSIPTFLPTLLLLATFALQGQRHFSG